MGIAAMDLFVVPTFSFRLLYGLLILWHGRRQILWLEVTAHPTAEWMVGQLTEACGWKWMPEYYNRARTHLFLNKDAPVPRAIQAIGASHANIINMFRFDFRQGQLFRKAVAFHVLVLMLG
jgi:hypothetical protein